MMNQRGNLLLGVLFLIVLIMLLPLIIKAFVPGVDLVYKIVLIFAIYSFVAQMLQGTGTITLLVTGVMVYFMVFKYGDIFTSLWFLSVILTLVGGTLLVTAARDFLGFGQEGGGHQMAHPPR